MLFWKILFPFTAEMASLCRLGLHDPCRSVGGCSWRGIVFPRGKWEPELTAYGVKQDG